MKSSKFSIITSFIKEALRRTVYLTFLKFGLSYLCLKSGLEEIKGHKDVPVMSNKLDLLLFLSNLQWCQGWKVKRLNFDPILFKYDWKPKKKCINKNLQWKLINSQ